MKKGFTLVELLAVIVILAIIAVIAVPQVLKIIEGSRKDAFVETARSLVKAAELEYVKTGEAKTYNYSDSAGERLDINGKEPDNGSIVVDTKGRIAMSIFNGKYCVQKDYSSKDISVIEMLEDDCNDSSIIWGELENVTDFINWNNITFNNDQATIGYHEIGFTNPKLNIPKSFLYESSTRLVTTIGENAFAYNNLEKIKIPNGVKIISQQAFASNNLQTIVIPSSVITIGNEAFDDNQLSSVLIPDSVTYIGTGAFKRNSPLKTVSLSRNASCYDTDGEKIDMSNCFADGVVITYR